MRTTLRRTILCAAGYLLAAMCVFAASHAWCAQPYGPAGLHVGVGCSESGNPGTAGAEAARRAQAAMGSNRTRLALVWDSFENTDGAKAAMLGGVGTVFDPKLVYGCSGFAPIAGTSVKARVTVLAIGGDVQVQSAIAEIGEGHAACGKKIGQALKSSAQAITGGRLLILLGDCHVPSDEEVVRGVRSMLGYSFPIAGGSHQLDGLAYYQGKAVRKSNIGLLISGPFSVGFSTRTGQNAEEIVGTARQAVADAIGGKPDKTALVLMFDCVGRLQTLGPDQAKELNAVAAMAPGTPVAGFYGSGEIGPRTTGSPSRGVGFHLSACAILRK